MFDELAGEVILARAPGRRTLDLGMGSRDVATWVRRRTPRKLEIVPRKDLQIDDPSAALAGFPDGGFDLIYSLWTFPYVGVRQPGKPDAAAVRKRLADLLTACARVLSDQGSLLIQLRNLYSLRGLMVGASRAHLNWWSGHHVHPLGEEDAAQLGASHERWDTARGFVRLVPKSLEVVGAHALGVFTVHGGLQRIPGLRSAARALEHRVRDGAMLRQFGGDVLVDLERVDPQLSVEPAEQS